MKKHLLFLGLLICSSFISYAQTTSSQETLGSLGAKKNFSSDYGSVVIKDYGECGRTSDDNVWWAITTGCDTMYITGSGEMDDNYFFSWEEPPYRFYKNEPAWLNHNSHYGEKVTTVIIDKNVEAVGLRAFQEMDTLQNFIVSPKNYDLTTFDGVLCSTDSSCIEAFPRGREGSYTIPSCFRYMTEGAFSGSKKLTSVIFPELFGSIEEQAFQDCVNLETVVFPKDSPYGGGYSIRSYAFWGCHKIKSVDIQVDNIYINNSDAWANCENLTSINVKESQDNISIDGCLFMKQVDGTYSLLMYPMASPRTEYTIPEKTAHIAGCAFYSAENLEVLTIPSGVTRIMEFAFNLCRKLKVINNLRETPAIMDSTVVAGLDTENCVLYVPKGCVDAYKSAVGWKEFKHIQEIEPTGINDVNAASASKARKVVKDGQIVIENNGKQYNVAGMEIK